jgi:hypothetical protein
MKRLLAANRCLLLAGSLAIACASLPASDDDEGLGVTSASTATTVPTTPRPVAGQAGGQAPTSTGGGVAIDAEGKASGVPGLSLRWHANKGRCLSRTQAMPTAGDAIVMAACASDTRQAFALGAAGQIHLDHNFCVGQGKDDVALKVLPCTDANATTLLVFAEKGSATLLSQVSGPMVPADAKGAPGTPVLIKAGVTTPSADAVWDFVGVGNQGGTAWVINGNQTPTQCLAASQGTAALAACNAAQAEQRWRFDGGLFVNDTGKCLDCDTPTLACTLKACSAVPTVPQNTHKWRFFLAFAFLAANGNSYVVGGNPQTGSVSLADPNGKNFNIGFNF